MSTLCAEIARKSANTEKLAARVSAHPELLPEVFGGLDSETARLKYGCLRLLRVISERMPSALYPEIKRLFELLDSECNILKWGAIIIIGNLAVADSEGKIDRILDRYLEPISGPVMITAANVVGGAGKIALAKPRLADRIARALLGVEAANYQTEECRNVVLGHAIEALDIFFGQLKKPQQVIDFVERQLHNRRNAVKQKAARFLKKRHQR